MGNKFYMKNKKTTLAGGFFIKPIWFREDLHSLLYSKPK